MTLATDQMVTIEQYQPGARFAQNVVLLGVLFAGGLFSALGYFYKEPECNWAWAGLGPLLVFILAIRLRSVTFEIDPIQRELHREAQWAGILVSSKTLPASDFTAIRLGFFDGGGDSFPAHWAQLIGAKKYTLVQSVHGAEVDRVARLVGELLGLEVVSG